MSIPFTQYLLPRGERRAETIERPAQVEALAKRFIDSGGRYECEILTCGMVSLTAVHRVDDEEQDIAIVLSPNGPDVPNKVDELVNRSIKFIEART